MKWVIALLLAASLVLQGCALRLGDPAGNVTTIGLVWSRQAAPLSQPVSEPARTRLVFGPERLESAPRWIELRAVGLILERTPRTSGITFGYKDSIWVFPVGNALTEVARDGRAPAQLRVSQP